MSMVTNIAVCSTCIYAEPHETEPWKKGMVACSLTRIPLVQLCEQGSCPKGKHAKCRGVVRAFGIDWYGLPAPLRLAWHLAFKKKTKLDGCGCIAVLKDWWTKMRRKPCGCKG